MSVIHAIPGFSEPFSSLSHLLAAGVFVMLGVSLLYHGWGNRGREVGICVFIFSCVFLLSMSGVFHLLEPGGAGREVMQRLDHAAIFVLIAGTFTPLHILLFRGWRRWGLLLLIWALGITGLTLKTIFFHQMPELLGLALYLGMGWLGLVSAYLIYQRYGPHFVRPLVYGALAYTLGAVLDFLHFPTLIVGVVGPHELFHVCVLFGIGYHWSLVRQVTYAHRTGGLIPRLKLSDVIAGNNPLHHVPSYVQRKPLEP